MVLDLSAAPFLDEDGAEAVRDLVAACSAVGLPVVFAEAASGVLERMTAAGVAMSGLAFATVDEACAAYLSRKPETMLRGSALDDLEDRHKKNR
jgi:hypothetical protein